MDTNVHCSICRELKGIGPNRLSSIFDGGQANAILLESENFAVIPSIGSLIAGHCLVVSKRHSSNVMYGLSSWCYHELQNDLRILLSRFADSDGTNQLFCFEHGKKEISDDEMLCSTAHGHLHIMPCTDILAVQVFDRLGATALYDVNHESFIHKIRSLENYIAAFVWRELDVQPSIGTVLNATGLPSQYLRRLIGDILGISEWDWKRFPRLEIVRETIDKLFPISPKG